LEINTSRIQIGWIDVIRNLGLIGGPDVDEEDWQPVGIWGHLITISEFDAALPFYHDTMFLGLSLRLTFWGL
jgi:hypothetical protein